MVVPLERLNPPVFSPAPGSYPISQYNLTVTITDPNSSSVSDLYYSLDYGDWLVYTGELTISPDTHVRAQAVSTSSDYDNSYVPGNDYLAVAETLLSPGITHDGPFTDPQSQPVTVTLTNPNNPAVSELVYQLNGGSWNFYSGPFSLQTVDYPTGVAIAAKSYPSVAHYLESPEAVAAINIEPGDPPVEMTTGIDPGSWSISGATATYTFTGDGTSIVLTEVGTSWSTGSINAWGAWSQPVDGTGGIRALFDPGESFSVAVFDALGQAISPDSIELHFDRLGGSSGAGIFTLQSGSWSETSGNNGFHQTATTVKTSLGGTNLSGGSVELNDSVSSMTIVNEGARDMIALQFTILK